MSTPSNEDPDTAGLTPLDDLVPFLDGLAQRHRVIRSGQRTRLPWPLRLAVMIRDGNTCCRCGAYVRRGGAELDHVVPWSAGGSDHSSNLRVLCRDCNQDRSNWVDVSEAPRQPATWWCEACCPEITDFPDYYDIPVLDAWNRENRGEAGQPAFDAMLHLPDRVLAFCCRCDSSGYTRWVL